MTKAHPDLLPPLEESPPLKQELDRYARFLDELVAYGTTLLAAYFDLDRRSEGTDVGRGAMVAGMQFRWLLELAGSISEQVRAGWTDPALVSLRALFEAAVGFQYYISNPSAMPLKGEAYMFMAFRRRMHVLEGLDSSTLRGKEMLSKLKKDEFLKGTSFAKQQEQIREEAAGLRAMLDSDEYKNARAAHASFNDRKPEWYWFFKGPQSFELLAAAVGKVAQYELLWRRWATRAHGNDVVSGFIGPGSSGATAVHQMRWPSEVHDTVLLTGALLFDTYTKLVKTFLPQRAPEVGKWYESLRGEFQRSPRITFPRE